MRKPAFEEVHTGDHVIDSTQRVVRDLVGAFNHCPFLDPRSRLISVQMSSLVVKTINHGLGVPVGVMVIRSNYGGYTAQAPGVEEDLTVQATLDEKNQIALVSPWNATFDLWFYPRASKPIDPNTGVGV